jgi:hypothetical protein
MTTSRMVLWNGWLASVVLAGFTLAAAGQESSKKSAPASGAPNDALRQELLAMMKEDQEARNAAIKGGFDNQEIFKKVEAVDRKNTARLKEVVVKYGWPGRTLVGEEAAHAAWLLVQHADRDRAFQKDCLVLMRAVVKRGEVSAKDIAYLTDRVLVGENKKQTYGTQFKVVDGKMVPSPIDDPANVDKRRKEVGLGPLGEYKKQLEQLYQPKESEKKKSDKPARQERNP